MKSRYNLLGFDFGASSGRAMLGTLENGRLAIEEIHRFSNDPVNIAGRFVWDLPRLFFEMKQALIKISQKGVQVDAIGIDTWGVDFGLIDRDGHLLGLPIHYRDPYTHGMLEKAYQVMPKEKLFEKTGLAFIANNTLFQLYALQLENAPTYREADKMLLMPDLLAYLLTGRMGTEYTISSTSQMIDPFLRDWSKEVLEAFHIPRSLLTDIVPSGTLRGTLLPEIARECKVGEIPVMAVTSHDTASAVAAIPVEDENFAFISSGTWSMIGAEIPQPLCDKKVMEANYANEGSVDGKIRLLKNLAGMWQIQECKREWERRGEQVSFSEMVEQARAAEPFLAFLDADDPCFMAPGGMPERIQEYCRRTGQRVPQTHGEFCRMIYESLALKYRWALQRLEEDLLKHPVNVLHVVGGGSKNEMLNQFTAEALNRPVVAGPGEATVIGNVLMQAKALGAIGSVRELRAIVAHSFPTRKHLPSADRSVWDAAYEKYLKIVGV